MKFGRELYAEIRRLREQAEEALGDAYRLGLRPHEPHLAERYAEIERKYPGWHERRAERTRARLSGNSPSVRFPLAPTPKSPHDMADAELGDALAAERNRLASRRRGSKDSPWLRLLEHEAEIRWFRERWRRAAGTVRSVGQG